MKSEDRSEGPDTELRSREELEGDYRLLQARYLELINSPGHKLLRQTSGLFKWLAPQGSRRGNVAYAATKGLDLWLTYGFRAFLNQLLRPGDWWARLASAPADNLTLSYQMWLADHAFKEADRSRLLAVQETWEYAPVISVLMPVYEPDPQHLREAIDGIRRQVYPHWELCLADDGSRKAEVLAVLREAKASDERIHLKELAANSGISAATNAAREVASGEFLALVDHDDIVYPDALHQFASFLSKEPDVDLIYSDEDQLSEGRLRVNPFFKPDWSPELLESMNYITHLALIRAELFDRVGGLRSEFDGSQDYDLFLRISRATDRIGHVPRPLYSWRRTAQSAASAPAAKPWAQEAGRRALDEHLEARGRGERALAVLPGRFMVAGGTPNRAAVSIIIPTRDHPELIAACLASLRQTTYQDVEIVLVDNDSVDEEALRLLGEHKGPLVRVPGPFNFPRLIDAGVGKARGDYLLFLNNDVVAPGKPWIEEMLRYATRPSVAAVGARLLYPDGQPQHEGIALCAGGVFAYNVDWRGYNLLSESVRNCSAVTAACMMTPRAVYEELGGFDPALGVAFNDVDYCLRAIKAGYRIVYTPHAQLTHVEAATRSNLHPPGDEQLARRRWAGDGCSDPYLSADLARLIEPFTRGQDRRRFLGREVTIEH